MGDNIKTILGITTIIEGISLADRVPSYIQIGFIVINGLLILLMLAHTSRYLHNKIK